MANSDGKLTKQDQDKVGAWLNEKGSHHACPVCQTNDWIVGEHLINNMAFSGGNLVVGGPTYPTAFVVCTNCAYVRQFMAVPLGITAQEPQKD